MSYFYLATPYTKYPDGIEAAFDMACKAAAELIRQGIRVYSPIAHTHPISIHGDLDPLDHSIWLPADEPFMATACGLIVYQAKTWENSFGISQEVKYFQRHQKPIIYWPLEASAATIAHSLRRITGEEPWPK